MTSKARTKELGTLVVKPDGYTAAQLFGRRVDREPYQEHMSVYSAMTELAKSGYGSWCYRASPFARLNGTVNRFNPRPGLTLRQLQGVVACLVDAARARYQS
jgi:hypothetical protein